MSYNRNKFLGASIMNYQASIGWGTQKTSVKINVVEDPVDGDVFLPPPLGTPGIFNFEGFSFIGILRKWEKNNSFQGCPVYQVEMEDPRDILEGCEVILGSYAGSIAGIPNLLNVYGFYESAAFGSSQNNGSGMPWQLVLDAIQSLTRNTASNFGGPLSFRNYLYSVDLSELPIPPPYYRIGGTTNIGLLTIISTICQDAGYDFYVEISQSAVIKIKTVNRYAQPPLGTLSTLIESSSYSGNVSRTNAGIELRNELTSAFVVGGPVQEIFEAPANGIQQFWGFSEDGEAIVSIPVILLDQNGNVLPPVIIDKAGHTVGVNGAFFNTFDLNAKDVAHIVGSNIYSCTELEICCALSGLKDWETYMEEFRPAAAALIGIHADVQSPKAQLLLQQKDPLTAADMANLNREIMLARCKGIFSDDTRVGYPAQMFNFIRGVADEYYGKKFLVEIPFTSYKVDTESFELKSSQEACDSAFFSHGATPLGLDQILQERFMTPDGKFQAISLYNDSTNVDLNQIQPGNAVFGTNGIFVKSQLSSDISSPTKILSGGGGIVIKDNKPHVVLEVSNALYEAPVDMTGSGLPLAGLVLGIDPNKYRDIMRQGASGIVNFRIHSPAKKPDWAAIPLKSNILVYGPWYALGAPGKVRFEVDTQLVPWAYGGYTLMNSAGNAKVTAGITFQQLSESGSIEQAGVPITSLGRTLSAGGPNITSININWSGSGITTTYSFQTFTPRFGVFERGNAERFKNIGQGLHKLQRNINQAIARAALPSDKATAANLKILYEVLTPDSLKRQSPHPVLLSQSLIDTTNSNRRMPVSSQSLDEVKQHLLLDDAGHDYSNTVVLSSLDSIFRPFYSSPMASGTDITSNYFSRPYIPNTGLVNAITYNNYNPYTSGNDFEIYYTGDGLIAAGDDPHAYLQGGPANARAIALRGPLVITGWGLNIDGNVFPSGSGLRQAHKWGTGPVDLLYDQHRSVWTCHDLCMGKLTGTLAASGGSRIMTLYQSFSGSTTITRNIYNFFSSPLASGSRVIAGWIPEAGKWHVLSADC